MKFASLPVLGLLVLACVSRLTADAEPVPVVELPITAEEREHWSFVPPRASPVPKVAAGALVRNPVDAFLLAKLEAEQLSYSPEADRLTLLRRLSYDLTGLPPTAAEQAEFLRDTSADAYEKLVERLLSSPHYGERWAQHWLDVLRYGESNGYEADGDRPHFWRFRDYVVRAFNIDMPFDQFLTEQLAGDELAQAQGGGRDAYWLWVASGMHRCASQHKVGGNSDLAEARQTVLTEMANGVGSTFLGLTVGCARCHDHKFDPFSQADYFRLQSFFANTQSKDIDLATREERAAFEKQVLDITLELRPLQNQLGAIDGPARGRATEAKKANLPPGVFEAYHLPADQRTPDQKLLAKEAQSLLKVEWNDVVDALTPVELKQRIALRERKHLVEARLPMPPMQVSAVANQGAMPLTYILHRGEVHKKKGIVVPTFPRVLVGEQEIPTPPAPARFTRLDLARWMTRPDHPLTARVFVNRIWMHHFGRGIVASPNDFGFRGDAPSHPELLDWLATQFIQGGWNIKNLHRLMVNSTAYRQVSTRPTPDNDPENILLGRMNRRRLEGEAIRDAMLATAGVLNRQVGGPMVRVPLEPEVYDLIFTEGEPDGLWPITPDAAQHDRRSIYLFAKRNVRLPLLEVFDLPDRISSCAQRGVSTFAPQALVLMNGPIAQEQSRRFAQSLLREEAQSRPRWIEAAYQRCYNRPPRPVEIEAGLAFFDQQVATIRERQKLGQPIGVPPTLPEQTDPAEAAALIDYLLALMNANEFIYIR